MSRGGATEMTGNPMADFLRQHAAGTRQELAASDSETWRVADLLGLANESQRARWESLSLGYTSPDGNSLLRHRIAETYRGVRAREIIATQGAQEALSLIFEALLTPDDHAILILPTYPHTEHALTRRCAVTAVALEADRGWALDLDRVAAALQPNTRLVVVNFPNNPTGALLPPEMFNALVSLCRSHNLILVNDEVYRLIDRDPNRRLPCVAEVYERGISVDAASKSLGLPGLRLGWMATKDAAIRALVMQALYWRSSCPASPSEMLADIALASRELILARNRAIALANLTSIDAFLTRHADRFSWTRPEGSVVGYVRYLGTGSVEAFTSRLAREYRVLVMPSSIWQSPLTELPRDHFRIGFGRRGGTELLGLLAACAQQAPISADEPA